MTKSFITIEISSIEVLCSSIKYIYIAEFRCKYAFCIMHTYFKQTVVKCFSFKIVYISVETIVFNRITRIILLRDNVHCFEEIF